MKHLSRMQYSLLVFVSIVAVIVAGVVSFTSQEKAATAASNDIDFKYDQAYLVEVTLPSIQVNGVWQQGLNVFGNGLIATEVTEPNDLVIDQSATNPKTKRKFVVVPETSISLTATNESMLAPLANIFPTMTTGLVRTVTVLPGTNNRVATISVPGRITDTTGLPVINGHAIIDTLRLELTGTQDNAQLGANVGRSWSKPFIIRSDYELEALAFLASINTYNGPANTTVPKVSGGFYTYDECAEIFMDQGLIEATAKSLLVRDYLRTAYVRINNNIVLPRTFRGLGTEQYPYMGNIDGRNCSVSIDIEQTNIQAPSSAYGLINYLGSSPSISSVSPTIIKNLNAYGSINAQVPAGSSAATMYVGGFAAYVNNPNALLINCTSNVTFTANSPSVACDIFAGGIIGYMEQARALATFALGASPSPSQRMMDYRLKYTAYGAVLNVNTTGNAYVSAGIAYVKNSSVRGTVINFDQSSVNAVASKNCYVGGVIGVFESNQWSIIAGNSLLGQSYFKMNARTLNTSQTGAEVAAAGMCAYLNQTGGKVTLYNNVIDTDSGTVSKAGTAEIIASDSTAQTGGYGDGIANIYAGGYYGKANTPNSFAEIPITAGFQERNLLHGGFLIEARQNGRSAGLMASGVVGHNLGYAVWGNVYAGGLFARGIATMADNANYRFNNIEVRAVQKYSSTNSLPPGASGYTSTSAYAAGRVNAGLISGSVESFSGSSASSNWVNVPITIGSTDSIAVNDPDADAKKFRLSSKDSTITAIREEGSTACSTMSAGGLFGTINRSNRTNGGANADNGNATPNTIDTVPKVVLGNIKVSFDNVVVNNQSRSYASSPFFVADFWGYEKRSTCFTGGLVGAGYFIAGKSLELYGSKSKVSCLQNAKGGTDMGAAEVYTGGLIGYGYSSTLQDISVRGTTDDSLGLSVDMVCNNGANSPCAGGMVGYMAEGYPGVIRPTRVTQVERGLVEKVTVRGESYNSNEADNYDAIVAGGIAMSLWPEAGSGRYLTVAKDVTVSNCSISAQGRDKAIGYCGGILGGNYGQLSDVTNPLLSRCLSLNNRFTANAQTRFAACGAIWAYIFHGSHRVDNCSSFGDKMWVRSEGTRTLGSYIDYSAGGGIIGSYGASSGVSLYNCFSNSEMFITHSTNSLIRRGGLVGATNATDPTYSNSFFHKQNSGTEYASARKDGVAVTGGSALRGLEFSNVVLSSTKTNQSVFNPSVGNLQNTLGSPTLNYASNISDTLTFSTTDPLSPTYNSSVFTQFSGGVWSFNRQPSISGDNATASHLYITPFDDKTLTGNANPTQFYFGTLGIVVTYQGDTPSPRSVRLFKGFTPPTNEVFSSYDTSTTALNTITMTYGEETTYTAFTDLNTDPAPPALPANFRNGFHNVNWTFWDSKADGTRDMVVPYSSLAKYLEINPLRNEVSFQANVSIDTDKIFYFRAEDFLSSSSPYTSPIVKVTVKPRYVTSIDIKSLPGFAERTATNQLGSLTNPYIIARGSTVRFFAEVLPRDATLTTYTFNALNSGSGDLTIQYKADGTVFIGTLAPLGTISTTLKASSTGKTDPLSLFLGGPATDEVHIRVVARVPVTVTNIKDSASVEANPDFVPSNNYNYVMTSSPNSGFGAEPLTKLPKTVTISSGVNSINVVNNGQFTSTNAIGSYGNLLSFDGGKTYTINGSALQQSILGNAGSFPANLIISIEYYSVLPVIFDTQIVNSTSGQSNVQIVYVTEGQKIKSAVSLTDPILSPKWDGYDFKGYLTLARPTAKPIAEQELDLERTIDVSTRYYARWQNIVRYQQSYIAQDLDSISMLSMPAVPVEYSTDTTPVANPNTLLSPEEIISGRVDLRHLPLTCFMDLTFTIHMDPKQDSGVPYVVATVGKGDGAVTYSVGEPKIGPNEIAGGLPNPYSNFGGLNAEGEKEHAYYTFVIPAQILTLANSGHVVISIIPSMTYSIGEDTKITFPDLGDDSVPLHVNTKDGIFTVGYTLLHQAGTSLIAPTTAFAPANATKSKDIEFSITDVLETYDESWVFQDVVLWKKAKIPVDADDKNKNDRVVHSLPKGTIIEVHHAVNRDQIASSVTRDVYTMTLQNSATSFKLSQMQKVGTNTFPTLPTYQQFTGTSQHISEEYYIVIKPPAGLNAFETVSMRTATEGAFAHVTSLDQAIALWGIDPVNPTLTYATENIQQKYYLFNANMLSAGVNTDTRSSVSFDVVNRRQASLAASAATKAGQTFSFTTTLKNKIPDELYHRDLEPINRFDWRHVRVDRNGDITPAVQFGYAIYVNDASGKEILLPHNTKLNGIVVSKNERAAYMPVSKVYVPAADTTARFDMLSAVDNFVLDIPGGLASGSSIWVDLLEYSDDPDKLLGTGILRFPSRKYGNGIVRFDGMTRQSYQIYVEP